VEYIVNGEMNGVDECDYTNAREYIEGVATETCNNDQLRPSSGTNLNQVVTLR
jgi:hypothetical protein